MDRDEAPEEPRSGSEARRQGKVPEYAAAMKKKLLALGQSEQEAEAHRLAIIERWSA